MKQLVLGLVTPFVSGGTEFSQQATPDRPAAAPIDYEAVRLSRIVSAVRISEKGISLDGRLDEAAWKLASLKSEA